MNAQRRRRIEAIRINIETEQAALREIATEERDAFDAMPESLQAGANGQKSEAAADAMEGAANDLDDILFQLTDAQQ